MKQTETVEITLEEWKDYLRLQNAAKRNGWSIFDILRKIGTMQMVDASGNTLTTE